MEISFTNMMAEGGLALIASSAHATYNVTQLRSAHRPFLPWRTLATGEQYVVIDFGAARTVKAFVLVHVNYTRATLQGHATNSWGAPSFSQELTIRRNPWTSRYQHGILLESFNYRFMRVLIPEQTPTNEVDFYSTGGLWLGTIASTPRPHAWQVVYRAIEPRTDVQPAHRGWRQRLVLGDPITSITVPLQSRANERTPGRDDQLEAWLDLQRRQREADYFVFFPVSDEPPVTPDPAQIVVTRNVATVQWRLIEPGLATSQWDLEEVITI